MPRNGHFLFHRTIVFFEKNAERQEKEVSVFNWPVCQKKAVPNGMKPSRRDDSYPKPREHPRGAGKTIKKLLKIPFSNFFYPLYAQIWTFLYFISYLLLALVLGPYCPFFSPFSSGFWREKGAPVMGRPFDPMPFKSS